MVTSRSRSDTLSGVMIETEPKTVELLAMLPQEMIPVMETMGVPRFHARQIFKWIHQRGINDPTLMTDLPKSLRQQLIGMRLTWPAMVSAVHRADDNTRKLQVRFNDGCAVETVLIPEGSKLTQCISSQVGCAVRCRFCRSGSEGFVRNLSAAEMLSQVALARESYLPGERLTNVVLMGIGEPLHNFTNSLRTIEILNHPDGLDLSYRRITLSTVGIVKGIDRLAEATAGKLALAISLHAADNATRAHLVPGVKSSVEEIMAALQRFGLPKRQRFTIEYVLIKGVNDSPRDARALVKLLSHLKVKINLLPLNPHDRTDLEPPDEATVLAFQQLLLDKGFSVYLRRRRGDEISAACGQLLATK